MNRKLKVLSVVFGVMAMTAAIAAPAQAWFTSSSSHTILHGTQVGNHVWTMGEGFGGITCVTAEFNGTASGTSTEDQTIIPTFAGCKDSFGRTVDVDNSALTYTYTTDGTVHVTGNFVTTITSGGSVVCTVVFKNGQTNWGIGYHNLSGTNGEGTQGVTLTTKTTDTITTTSGGFFNCGVSNGEHTNGTYQGHSTWTGRDTAGNPVGISVHGPTEP